MTAARFERSRDALVKDFTEVLTEADSLLKQATKESGEKASDLVRGLAAIGGTRTPELEHAA